jgi:cytochrome c peroxidase
LQFDTSEEIKWGYAWFEKAKCKKCHKLFEEVNSGKHGRRCGNIYNNDTNSNWANKFETHISWRQYSSPIKVRYAVNCKKGSFYNNKGKPSQYEVSH